MVMDVHLRDLRYIVTVAEHFTGDGLVLAPNAAVAERNIANRVSDELRFEIGDLSSMTNSRRFQSHHGRAVPGSDIARHRLVRAVPRRWC